MKHLFEKLKPTLLQPLVYSDSENKVIVPFNVFMTTVSEFLPVRKMDKRAELIFCLYTRKVLEHAWKKFAPTPAEQSDDPLRFLDILVRYLLNSMKVSLPCVISFVETGTELDDSDIGRNVTELAQRSFDGFIQGNVGGAVVFKAYIDQMNASG